MTEPKNFCPEHSGNTACILGLKKDHTELKGAIKDLTEADLKLGERLSERIDRCQVCADTWKESYNGKLETKMSTKLFTWLFSAVGVIGLFIIATLVAQLGMMYKLETKVEVSIAQQAALKMQVQTITDRLDARPRN